MIKRWFQPPQGHFLLLGPRRAGKTTFLKAEYPGYSYATLDDFDHYNWAKSDPKGFVQELGERAIIDEIQRVPKLTQAVKHKIDQDNSHIIMTGSSSIGLLDASADTLAGRIDICHFPTLCWGEELGAPAHNLFIDRLTPIQLTEAQRSFEQFLHFGGFPEVATATKKTDKQEILRRYRNTYFTRDLAQLSNIENIEGLLAILHHVGRSTGSHLEVSNFAMESGLSFPTAKKYLGVLTQSDLAFKLYGYHFGPAKRYLKAAKMYYCDTGMISALGVEITRGQIVESFVIAELEKRRKLRMFQSEQLYYYKSKGGAEVDLIYEADREIIAIEIKASKTIAHRDLSNLYEYSKQNLKKEIRCYFLYLGDTYQNIRGIECIPIYALRGARL